MKFPNHWKIEPLEDCLSALIDYRGKTPTKTSFGIPLITAKIVKDGRIEEPTEFVAFDEYESWMTRGKPQIGDVLLTTEAPLGEVAQLQDAKIALAQRLILLRGEFNKLDNTFLKYSLISSFLQSQLISRSSGTTVLGIKQSELRKVLVPLPPIQEQKEIARILISLDERIELSREMNETLEATAQAFFNAWFVDFEPVKANLENRLSQSASEDVAALFPNELEKSELGLIPRGWQVKELTEVLEVNPARKLSKGQNAKYLDMANVPIVGHCVANFVEREFSSGTKFMQGDTLLARITPCLENGKTAFVDFLNDKETGWGSTEFIVLRPKNGLPNYFAYLLSRQPDFRAFAIQSMTGTSGRQRVQVDSLGRYKIAVPPETSPINKLFAEITDPLVEQITHNSTKMRVIKSLRDSLLPKLISGEIRVPVD